MEQENKDNKPKGLRIVNLNKSRSGTEEDLKKNLEKIEENLSNACVNNKLDFIIGRHTGPKNEAFLFFRGPVFDNFNNNPLEKLDRSRDVLIELTNFVNKIIIKNKMENHVEYTSLKELEAVVSKLESLAEENEILRNFVDSLQASNKEKEQELNLAYEVDESRDEAGFEKEKD